MNIWSGPIPADSVIWEFRDDGTQQRIARVNRGGTPPPGPGTVLCNVVNCANWLVTGIGGLEAVDLSQTPPLVCWPVYGHCLEVIPCP